MMRANVVSLLAVFFCQRNIVEPFGPKSGPYDMVFERMETCEDEGTGQIKIGTKISSKGHGVYTYTGVVSMMVPGDESIKVVFDLQILSNGIYRPRFMTVTLIGCEKLKKVGGDVVDEFLAAADYYDTNCPLAVGNYSVKDWALNLRLDSIPTMIYGSYKLVGVISYSGTRVGCVTYYGRAVPKTTSKN